MTAVFACRCIIVVSPMPREPTAVIKSAAPAASRIGRCRGPGLWMPTSANAEPHSGQRATEPIEPLRS